MTWLYLSLITAVLWALGQVLAKKGFEHISVVWTNILAAIWGVILVVPIALLLINFQFELPPGQIIFLIFLVGACYTSYFYAISQGELALSGTVLSMYPVFTIIPSYFFLGERLSFLQFIGIIITIIGVVITAWPSEKIHTTSYKWLYWGLLGAFLNGIGEFFNKIITTNIGPEQNLITFSFVYLMIVGINFVLDKKGRTLPTFDVKTFLPTIIGVGFTVLGTVSLFFAFAYGQASLITPITSSYAVLVVILSLVFLKEKITHLQTLGIIATVSGVIMIGVGV